MAPKRLGLEAVVEIGGTQSRWDMGGGSFGGGGEGLGGACGRGGKWRD